MFILPPLRIVDSVVASSRGIRSQSLQRLFVLLLLLLLYSILAQMSCGRMTYFDRVGIECVRPFRSSSSFHSAENDVECLNVHDAFVFFIGCLSDCCCSLNMIRSSTVRGRLPTDRSDSAGALQRQPSRRRWIERADRGENKYT